MNNNESQNKGAGFLQGFLWGAILGGGIVFLLGTKKGKKLLKIITEEGIDGISNIGELVEDELEEYEEEPVVQNKQTAEQVKKPEIQTQNHTEEKPSGVKHLFKNIRKKS